MFVPSEKNADNFKKSLAQTTIRICELNPDHKTSALEYFSFIKFFVVPLIRHLPAIRCPIPKVNMILCLNLFCDPNGKSLLLVSVSSSRTTRLPLHGECNWVPDWFEDFMMQVKFSSKSGKNRRLTQIFKIVACLKLGG